MNILNGIYKEILSKQQFELLPVIAKFSKQYYLVGETAIALYLGHRRSIDYDLFTIAGVRRKNIKNILASEGIEYHVLYEEHDQIHVIIGNVKVTFYSYPFPVNHPNRLEDIISMPELIDLAAMKAFALGGRAKWKDYIDMFFLLKDHFSIEEIEQRAEEIFRTAFNAKLFRQQLTYHKDIDYSEAVNFLKKDPGVEEIKRFLTDVATIAF